MVDGVTERVGVGDGVTEADIPCVGVTDGVGVTEGVVVTVGVGVTDTVDVGPDKVNGNEPITTSAKYVV